MAQLGDLSAHFESNGNPGAIGFDTVGGFSYGMYQIAARVGTMDEFLKRLAKVAPREFSVLQAAGGSLGALNGTPAFKAAWKQLAATEHDDFAKLQHDFIKETHYDPQILKLKANFGIDVETRSAALRDMLWSMAVQLGGLTQKMFKNALDGKNIPTLTDAELITLVYTERSNVDKYFSSSNDQIKKSLKNRFQEEKTKALAMLASESH